MIKFLKKKELVIFYLDKKKYFLLYLQKIVSYFFIDINSSIKNYYNPLHTIPIMIFSICSIPGALIALKKYRNSRIIYLFLLTCFLVGFISIFFILPRYKISIISFQILFSLFFFKYFIEKIKRKLKS